MKEPSLIRVITLGGNTVELWQGQYIVTGYISLFTMMDVEYGDYYSPEIHTQLTSNLVDAKQAPDEVAMKTYGGNEGFMEELIAQGILSEPVRYELSGYVNFPICKLLIQAL